MFIILILNAKNLKKWFYRDEQVLQACIRKMSYCDRLLMNVDKKYKCNIHMHLSFSILYIRTIILFCKITETKNIFY